MNKPFHHLVRGVIIKNNKLLVAHAIGHRNTFLPGGHIEFGESAKDALVRESNEELGVVCVVGSFIGLVEHKWMKLGVVNCEVNQLFEVQCDDLNDYENPKSNESYIEFFWIPVDELDEHHLQSFLLRQIIQSYMNDRKEIHGLVL